MYTYMLWGAFLDLVVYKHNAGCCVSGSFTRCDGIYLLRCTHMYTYMLWGAFFDFVYKNKKIYIAGCRMLYMCTYDIHVSILLILFFPVFYFPLQLVVDREGFSATVVCVWDAVAGVMVTMTVEITVMKKDAVRGPVCTCTCSWVHFLL